MQTYSKLQALKDTFDLWVWMYDNPGKNKNEYPLYKNNKVLMFDCPCCEYARDPSHPVSQRECSDCPLKHFWTKHKKIKLCITCTHHSDSPFYIWENIFGHGCYNLERSCSEHIATSAYFAYIIELDKIERKNYVRRTRRNAKSKRCNCEGIRKSSKTSNRRISKKGRRA